MNVFVYERLQNLREFVNYFCKTKAKNNCFMVLNYICPGLQKSTNELMRLNKRPKRCDI